MYMSKLKTGCIIFLTCASFFFFDDMPEPVDCLPVIKNSEHKVFQSVFHCIPYWALYSCGPGLLYIVSM